MQRRFFFWACGAVLAAGAALFAIYQTSASPGSTRAVAFGAPVRQDDFTYTVVGLAKSKAVGSGFDRADARGTFYVVTVRVENHALRVAFQWEPSMVFVVDNSGKRYLFSTDGQRALDAANPHAATIEHGDSANFTVAFDLPKDVQQPALAFSNGIMMGDVFDGAAYLKARVPLN